MKLTPEQALMVKLLGVFTKVIETVKKESDGKYQGIIIPYHEVYSKWLVSADAAAYLGIKDPLTKEQVIELLSKMEAAKMIALPKGPKGTRILLLPKDVRERSPKQVSTGSDIRSKYGF